MENFLSIVQAVIKIGFWRGLTLSLVGTIMIYLTRNQTISEADAKPWIVGFWLLVVIGLVTMLVYLLERVTAFLGDLTQAKAENRKRLKIEKAKESVAYRNIDLLDAYERRFLLAVLVKGEQRFSNIDGMHLYEHHICQRPVGTNSTTAWMIRDSVWERREEAIKFLRKNLN